MTNMNKVEKTMDDGDNGGTERRSRSWKRNRERKKWLKKKISDK